MVTDIIVPTIEDLDANCKDGGYDDDDDDNYWNLRNY